jgi:hypothetical protein
MSYKNNGIFKDQNTYKSTSWGGIQTEIWYFLTKKFLNIRISELLIFGSHESHPIFL